MLLLVASLATASVAVAEQPPILNSLGERLESPQIKSFDGTTFEVIHAGGVSRIPWDKMPEAYRAGYVYNPEKGARENAHRIQQVTRDMKETQRRENTIIKDQGTLQKKQPPVVPPTVTGPANPGVRRLERTVPMLTPTHLAQLGGPNMIVTIQQINPLEVQYRQRRGNWRTVPLHAGVGDQLTLLFEDGAGCKTYFLDRASRNQGDAILVFERPAESPVRPKSRSG